MDFGPVSEFREVDSTMRIAREMLKDQDPPFVVVADRQTTGRGQRGRVWHSPPGNIYMTMALQISEPVDRLSLLPLKAGYLVGQWVGEKVGEHQVALKWPNDVLLNRRKIAGILCESSNCDQGFAVLIGIGVNVVPGEHPFPGSASLAEVSNPSPVAVLRRELLKFMADNWWDVSWENIPQLFMSRSLPVGSRIFEKSTQSAYEFQGVASSGRLLAKRLSDQQVVSYGSASHDLVWTL